MRILFCNIAWMKFYKGANDDDKPVNGGSYIKKHGTGGEENNFLPVEAEDGNTYCYGFVETKSTAGNKSNELHIEKIEGCELLKQEETVEDVLVVFCARPDRGKEKTYTCVVGWYRHATVLRNYDCVTLEYDGQEEEHWYNIVTEEKDVVLLPAGARNRRTLWWVPRANEQGFGFGQANVWFPVNLESDAAKKYIDKLVSQIETYDGENWIDRYE